MNRNTWSLLRSWSWLFVILWPLMGGDRTVTGAAPPALFDVDLPSTSTGPSSGTLAVRISAPASLTDARYPDGAPVLIWVPGGFEAGSLRHGLSLTANDVIIITFLFPGGFDPVAGRRSIGVYDQRGPNSILALRDVIRFAAGELRDSRGRTIDEVVPVPVHHTNIGLLGASNGGNIVVAVAAEHSAELAGHLRYIMQWESPVSSQITTTDLGGVRLDCPGNQRIGMRVVNPRYLAYGPLELDMDYAQLAYDPGDVINSVTFDGNGDGRYTTVIDPSNGCRSPDLNLNRRLELDEDFPLGSLQYSGRRYYSRPVTRALADMHVFAGEWPTNIAPLGEAEAFWDLREAARLYGRAVGHIADLEGMILASVDDHVQTAPDHPHIRQAFEGWLNAGAWVQINPSRSFVIEADPISAGVRYPENASNTPPEDWSDRVSYCAPENLRTEVLQLAAVRQMADRARARVGSATWTAPSPMK